MPLENAAQAGFDAARELVDRIAALNDRLGLREGEAISMSIGLACGEAVVGDIGAPTRYTYGAVADCVNLAARLQGLTRETGLPVLMSGQMRQHLNDDPGMRVECLAGERA